MTGFEGLVLKQFEGDVAEAKRWTARLGKASYFRYSRPQAALNMIYDYKDKFPHLFVWKDGAPTAINWQDRRRKRGKGRKTGGEG